MTGTHLWIGVAALLAIALLFLMLPGWRHGAAEPPLRRRLTMAGLLVLFPGTAVGLYLHLGAPAIIEEQALLQAQSNYDAEGMVQALENKLKAQPEDAQGWYALGRAYIAFQRYADAERALGKAMAQSPEDARILAQYAEALGLQQGHLEGRPMEILQKALEISYEETKALELAGLAAFQKERWAESLHYWRRLLQLLPKETEHYEAIEQAVRTAERRLDRKLGGTGMPAPATPVETKAAPH